MDIRVMVPEDYDKVYRLWLDTPGMGLNGLDDSREGIARYLARNPNTSFVAEEDGVLLGSILCGHDGRRGFIYHTAVAESARRRGVASLLVDAALGALGHEGIHKAALVAFAGNGLGNAFWESRGFSVRNDLTYRNKELCEIPYHDREKSRDAE